ncbi:MAG TPA: polysaccharide biosynthesis/export family protein [Chthoniobacterales bacterium]|jgi:protein involved in polysaccharide export with SLBB domain
MATLTFAQAPALRPVPRPAAPPNPAAANPAYPGGSSFTGAASTVATTTSMAVLDDSRRLGVGDVVSFRVVEDRDVPVQLMVTDSGEMEVPYIGRVKAAGRTCKALATSVKSSLEVDYYYRATVIIALDAANDRSRGRVTVSGEVLTQGSQEIPPTGDLTASKALANAGGITRFGDQRDVRIIRQTPQGAQTIKFDYKNYLNNKAEDILLQPNDTVNVRARTVVW